MTRLTYGREPEELILQIWRKVVQESEDIEVFYIIGKIDRSIYSCITDDIVTDEVIITDVQIRHIKDHHPNDYERFAKYFGEIVEHPDYILKTNKPNSGIILKEIIEDGLVFKTILRIVTSSDDESFKNSIITFMKIDKKEWDRLLRNKVSVK